MGWSAEIPPRSGWYWVRGPRPDERRVVFLDYGSSRVYDGLHPPREPPTPASILEYCWNGRHVEWWLPALPPPL